MAPAHLITKPAQPTPADGAQVEATQSSTAPWERPACIDNGQLELVIDVQLFQLTLKAASPQALPPHGLCLSPHHLPTTSPPPPDDLPSTSPPPPLHLPSTSPPPPAHLGYISACARGRGGHASPRPCISAVSRLHLPCISLISRLRLGYISAASRQVRVAEADRMAEERRRLAEAERERREEEKRRKEEARTA